MCDLRRVSGKMVCSVFEAQIISKNSMSIKYPRNYRAVLPTNPANYHNIHKTPDVDPFPLT